MRNSGIVLILILFGITFWMAYERELPVEASAVRASAVTPARRSPVEPIIPKEQVSQDLPDDQSPNQAVENELNVLSDPYFEEIIPELPPVENNRLLKRPEPVEEFNRMVIPSLKVRAKIKSKPYAELTWDLSDLGHDIAHLGDVPGQETENNLIFAGHVTVRNGSNGPFRYLRKLSPGDKIILYKGKLKYTYRVLDQVLVYPDQTSVLEDTSQPQVTLITCATWDEESLSYLRRLIISAELEKIENEEKYYD
jgi:LPXTG-site transpeptidase (sortase) family protein